MNVINKIRAYGVKTVVQYLLRNVRTRLILKSVLKTARKRPLTPARGITVAGQLTDSGSVNKTLRDFIWALKRAGIPYQTLDFSYKHDAHREDYEGLLTDKKDFNLTRYTHLVELGKTPIPDGIVQNRACIFFWEYDSGVMEAFPNVIKNYRTIISMCDFNERYFKEVFPKEITVRKVLYPFRFLANADFDRVAIRRKYGYAPEDFLVFFNYNFKTGYNRKNPKATIIAFATAFKDVPNARLLFKTQKAKMFPDAVAELNAAAESFGVADRFRMIDTYIPERDIYGLTDACDVYISLHRGEGFGLGMAEAMSLGKPVIATNYSANTEFTVEGAAIPVPYKVVPVQSIGCDPSYYYGVKEWPEPDVGFAAAALRKLYDSPEYARELGVRAREFIREHYSTENFRKTVEKLLAG